MAQTIVIPQCSVSPAGGGTCAFARTTFGPIPFTEYDFRGIYYNFRYSATPAAGYRFSHFHIVVEETNTISGTRIAGDWNESDNPYESDYLNWGGQHAWDASAWWIEQTDGNYSAWISSITVEAVFEEIPRGPYLICDDATAKLVYDGSTKKLVYGGAIT